MTNDQVHQLMRIRGRYERGEITQVEGERQIRIAGIEPGPRNLRTYQRHDWHCPCVACRIDRGEDEWPT